MKQLAVNGLTFSYDGTRNAVDNVSFNVKKGDYVTVIGHNGSGKSTLAKLIIGLLESNAGTIEIDELRLNPENVYDIREKIAIVFQNPDNQFIGSTVRDDIAFGLENRMIAPDEMDSLIQTYSKRVGMEDFLNHEPTKLSGGQKQRVAIAGVLAMQPELLVLDEATSMLDPKGRKEVNDLVHELHTENKMSILSITHDIEEVTMSDYVIVMNEGKIAMQGTPEEILIHAERLVALSLDIPFSLKFFQAMMACGIELSTPYDLEGMVEELCQLRSKM
ncbi:energy-coupling factor transporter ATPase [Erysipelothrix enhydrae]|uniref:energy-coupling factor transporter ATPase n=1 Tax=Erysipelothrix enhydrae TaxID=2890314 RepID=UPI002B250B64|nr:energy-coupling factor transporter ATPase [Erysipelothrix sp. 4322-04]WRB87096.1 energy-coupling factor transporter ATPase [Erysipelothrix sp. 4322-04]